MSLTSSNFRNGFLVDDQLMAGVGENKDAPGFFAYVLRPESGEYLGYEIYQTLDEALQAINSIPRDWVFESIGGCDGSRCAEGKCKEGGCKLWNPNLGESLPNSCSTDQSLDKL